MTDTAHVNDEELSAYYDGALDRARAESVRAHLASCTRCTAEYETFRQALGALSGLHPLRAPEDFDDQVAGTIHRRSGGRFFGRRAFGDRIPYEFIAVVALVLAAAIVLLFRFSSTGHVHDSLETPAAAPPALPEKARRAIPSPSP